MVQFKGNPPMTSVNDPQPAKPKTLNRPVRKFVKRRGKKLMRWAAKFQSKQSTLHRQQPFPVSDRVRG
jgi:hypothetical protein